MSNLQPIVTAAAPRRRQFVTSPIALQAIIINQAEEVLLLFSPSRNQGWQVVSGGYEAGETLLAGTIREVHEELGPEIRLRPLGLVHAQTFHYDKQVQYMLGVYYLFAYQGGAIQPGDDMTGSAVRWWSLAALDEEQPVLHVSAQPWLLARAVELYRLWVNQPDRPLQPAL